MSTLELVSTAKTSTMDELIAKVTEMCKLQAQIDALKAEVRPFLQVGESVGSPLGKLTLCKGSSSFVWTAAGERKYEEFKREALEAGLGKFSVGSASLRLTLNANNGTVIKLKGKK